MTQRKPGIRIIETPEEKKAIQDRVEQEFMQEMRELAEAEAKREQEIPLVKEATAKMEWLISIGSGAGEGAAAVLKYCYRGSSSHTLKYDDLGRFDTQNTELALLLISTVARQKYPLPEEYLGPIGQALFE